MFIIASISRDSYGPDKIEEIVRAGAEVLRYNFSHGTPTELEKKIAVARSVITQLGMERRVKILADLPGAKIRIGDVGKERYVVKGEQVLFRSMAADHAGDNVIPVDFPDIGAVVSLGQTITLADGELGFVVEEICDEHSFRARALNGHRVLAYKGIHLGRIIDELDHFTPLTRQHIAALGAIKPEWVAFSFANSAAYLEKGAQLLVESLGYCPTIVAKIESEKGVANIDEICRVADVILIARGDLGLNCPIEFLGVYQKQIIDAAKRAGKQVVVSTQILDSLLSYHVPCRADVLDLTHAVHEGADAIMLAQATGVSTTPGYSVSVARTIIDAVERSMQL